MNLNSRMLGNDDTNQKYITERIGYLEYLETPIVYDLQ